ncbi:MAG: hypothetical protein AB7O28_04225 [Vicinamibacterales bacterium]
MWVLALERTPFDPVQDRTAAARVWRDARDDVGGPAPPAERAQLTLTRDSPHDFRDRQVYVWVDGESWGKLKYGVPLTQEISPGPHRIRVNNTLFNDRLTFTASPGEHVKVRCTNGMPRAGWLMLLLLHVTYLSVTLERER